MKPLAVIGSLLFRNDSSGQENAGWTLVSTGLAMAVLTPLMLRWDDLGRSLTVFGVIFILLGAWIAWDGRKKRLASESARMSAAQFKQESSRDGA